jgi:hypothetical protein
MKPEGLLLSDVTTPMIDRGSYVIDVGWWYLEQTLQSFSDAEGLDLDPDFQRAHVWNQTQQERYVEYILRGGYAGKEIYWNSTTWNGAHNTPVQIVDGKQRLEAVRKFLRGETQAFGHFYNEYSDRAFRLHHARFTFYINNLRTRREVLQWYLDINRGGTQHTEKEIDKVRRLLAAEEEKPNG